MPNPTIQGATLGDILVDEHGQEWEIIAYTDLPTFTLERVRMLTAYDHTRQSVVPNTPWAATWRKKQ